ncbi:Predicted Zn-dependent protease [Chitinophaga sp. CF118]|uniref:gliding motility protein GldB-related protein n=1 Tax=Chitinophaga sp. CF118 TaxID=1884367 RepID=UPI0008F03287|nr:DUF2268 domain-containing putative Zn-dependent protease [Chitinophaga sp. CF118]SFD26502.1 Predicted Zn-dependent protease [Chitinophaga sp. CF118]
MKKIYPVILLIVLSITANAQTGYHIITSDVDHFWKAYDLLQTVHTKTDSVAIIQQNYIDIGSTGLQEFIRLKTITAENYVASFGRRPKFWKSVRPSLSRVSQYKNSIDTIFSHYQKILPDFHAPDVCFVVGYLTSAGTATDKFLIIGSEIAAADSTVERSELKGYIKEVIGTMEIPSIVAHELIHTQQNPADSATLLSSVIEEGAADFIPLILSSFNINVKVHAYGATHQCELWQQFKTDLSTNNYAPWLYNGATIKGKPADLGYYIGSKICEAYYDKQKDKQQALRDILKSRQYEKILLESRYNGGCQ